MILKVLIAPLYLQVQLVISQMVWEICVILMTIQNANNMIFFHKVVQIIMILRATAIHCVHMLIVQKHVKKKVVQILPLKTTV